MCIAGPRMSSGLLLASLLVSGNSEDDQLRQVPQQGFPHPSAAGLLRAPSSPILAVVVLFAAPYVAAPWCFFLVSLFRLPTAHRVFRISVNIMLPTSLSPRRLPSFLSYPSLLHYLYPLLFISISKLINVRTVNCLEKRRLLYPQIMFWFQFIYSSFWNQQKMFDKNWQYVPRCRRDALNRTHIKVMCNQVRVLFWS